MNNFVFLFVIALCGTCTNSSRNRIAGGSPATVHHHFPYMISLQQNSQVNTPTRGHRCGGALVSLRHAVTAAFCVFDSQNGVHTPLNPNEYRVFAGAIDLTNDTSADHHRGIERFTVHPDYRPGNLYVNDIAVITLTSAFSTNNVQIAPLATNDVQESLSHCTSSGWGAQNNLNVVSTQLMHLQKFAMADNNDCQRFYIAPWVPQLTLQDTMICAMALGSYSSCQGDLGNPLVCSGNLQGILVSTGYSSCSVANQPPRPELYTRISSFRSWIRTTAGASAPPDLKKRTFTSSSRNRIAGGSPATVHNHFPYMISLQQNSQVNTPTRGHRCGGALVSLRHAVTAAFCVFDSQNGVHTPLNPNEYRVFAGAIDLTNDTSADHHRGIERFTVHPDYRPGNLYVNDIAVITLTSAFSTNNVQIAPLATNDVQESLSHCTSSGWGAQNNLNVVSTQLMHLQKFAMADNNDCQRFYIAPWVPQLTLQDTMICAMALGSYSSCQGDLGNPLVCSGNLQGILVSTGYSSCSVANQPPRPELYTRISSFRSWIRTTAGASSFQPAMGVLAVITVVQIIKTSVLN